MNSTHQTAPATAAPNPTSGHWPHVPSTSMLPGTETAPPAAVESFSRAVRGAHQAVDRFADSATPRIQQLSDGVANAEAAVRARADQVSRTGVEWTASVRNTVRSYPLCALAAALALGAVIARVTR